MKIITGASPKTLLLELYKATRLNEGQDLENLKSHIRILESEVMADHIRLHGFGVRWS
ncbi:MAG: hypothetical protein WBP65_25370 [Candidatus Sulfotelmatobacter sp.]|jgi:hypothetical protein